MTLSDSTPHAGKELIHHSVAYIAAQRFHRFGIEAMDSNYRGNDGGRRLLAFLKISRMAFRFTHPF